MRAAQQTRRWIVALCACAVLARVAAGLPRGAEGALHDGYEFYVTISHNWLAGNGWCYSVEGGCAERTPLYPMWLAPFLAAGVFYPGVIIAQAVVGASLAWITWQLGTLLFGPRAGVVAAAAAAFSPYGVIHDTALQDTVFVNVLIPLAMLLLLRACRSGSAWEYACGGLALSLAVLANARMASFVPCALGWVVFAGDREWPVRLRAAALTALPIVLLVGGWMARNAQIVGAPVLTTESGQHLWFANNAATFNYFPARSIDWTIHDLDRELPQETRVMLERFPGTEAQRDAFVRQWGIDYMLADPLRTAISAARKIRVAAAAQFSPARGELIKWGYAAVFLPVHLLAGWTLLRTRHEASTHSLTWLLLLSFLATTGLYWAHTSHKSYLDAVLFVYAAAALTARLPTRTAAVPA